MCKLEASKSKTHFVPSNDLNASFLEDDKPLQLIRAIIIIK